MLAIWRRGPVVVLALVIGLAASLGIARLSAVKYESTALIVVVGSPSTANGAESLAATYAGFIPQDENVQHALANAIGITNPTLYSSVGKRLVATVVTNSAIVSLSFTAPTPNQAQAGLHTLVSDLTLGVPQWKSPSQSNAGCSIAYVGTVAQTRPPNTSLARAAEVEYYCPLSQAIPLAPAQGDVVLVKDAGPGVRSTPGSTKTGALGGVLGLLLGLVAAVAWERSDRRTDDLDDLRAEVECPAWEGALTPAIAVSILGHWRRNLPDAQIQVGLVKVGRCDHYALAHLQRTIQQAARNQAVAFRNIDLGGQSVLEGLDTKTPIVVLCVGQGTAVSKLRDTVRRLVELGHPPEWAFLLPSATIGERLSTPKETASALASSGELDVAPATPAKPDEKARATELRANGHDPAEQATNGRVPVRPDGPRRRIAERGPTGRSNRP